MATRDEINVFAKTNFRNREVSFGIKKDDRRRHVYIIGKTGMGKTTLIENMIAQDIQAGYGVAFVDPHGDSVEKILNYIPSSRINDVVYFNPADLDYPIAFNPLESVDPKYKHLVASGLMGVFTKMWANVWSARMEYILNNTILALLDTPGNTMLGIARMLVDKKFRKRIVDNIRDPVVKSFWVDEFANYNDKYRSEAIAPIQNKVGQFLSSAIIRNIVGQPKSSIDLRELMDQKKILLLNLSKGRIGEDNSALLGAMFITKLQLAAMSRVDVPEEERPDFYLYVDEFQNFATESFATILSEARKYRLNLIIAHQYIGQLITKDSTKIRDAVFGNVGTMIIFRIGATDAEALESEFDPIFTPNNLVNLTKFHIYLKLMINGVSSSPFSAITLPPLAEKTENTEKVIKVSRERYGNPRDEIEEKITRWMGQEYHREMAGQDLTEEEEEDARGGVVFKGKTANSLAGNFPEVETEILRSEAQHTTVTKPSFPSRPQIKTSHNDLMVKPVWPKPATSHAPTRLATPRPFNRDQESSPPHRDNRYNNANRQNFHPAPRPNLKSEAKTRENPIWQKVAAESEKKTQDAVKKVSRALVFRFGPKNEQAPKTAEAPKQDIKQDERPKQNTTLKPGETVKF